MGEGITRNEFLAVVRTLQAIFSHEFMKDKFAFETFYKAIQDIPCDAVQKAVDDYIKEMKFPPTPADIREWADEYIEKVEGEECEAAKRARERYLRGEEYDDENAQEI